MNAPLYAEDSIGVHHVVAYADSLSARVTTICKHPAFTLTKRLSETRPHPDVFCQSCKAVEDRRAQSPAEPIASAVSGSSTPIPIPRSDP